MLPLMLDVSGWPVLVVGAGSVGLRRALKLAQAGAFVTVKSLRIAPETRARLARAGIQVAEGPFETEDLTGMRLTVAASSDREVNAAIVREAGRLGILVSSATPAGGENISFPAQIRRGELIVSVWTGGASPALSRQIREQLEAYLPEDLGERTRLLKKARAAILARASSQGHPADSACLRELAALPAERLGERLDKMLCPLENGSGKEEPS